MTRRLLAIAAIALAGVSLTACSFSLGAPGGATPSTSPESSEETTDEGTDPGDGAVDEFGFTADQRILLDKMFVATAGQDYATFAATDPEQAQNVAQQYLSGAESLCSLDPATRESDATHNSFVSSFTSTSGMDDATGEAVWSAIIEYCAAGD
ncbi:MAG: hypothetical protein QM598_11410 [Protaetiibacter sp.]